MKDLPVSFNLSYFWNLGSLLGLILTVQILTGFFLVFYYSNYSDNSFFSVQYIMYEVNFGWMIRLIHFNLASFFFLVLFFHFFKGLILFSYRLKEVWFFGLLILLLVMMVAFLGYVLVWAQMSFWAGIVITSLLSVVPFCGLELMYWVWGSFLFSLNSLKIFFFLHFLLPLFIFFLVFFHLFFLHFYGSTSKNFFFSGFLKKTFFPFFWFKDFINFFFFLFFFLFFLNFPFKMGDTLMFESVNFLVSPVHIVPEWYFLFAYAILRSVPNKMLGVFFLLLSIIFFFLGIFFKISISLMDLLNKFFCFFFLVFWLLLTFLGGCFLDQPFLFLSFFFMVFYFFMVFLIFLNFWLSLFLFFFL